MFFPRIRLTAFRLYVCILAAIFLADGGLARAQFDYGIYDGKVTIRDYTGPEGAIVIPDFIEGKPVVSFWSFAFSGKAGVTEITVPETFTILPHDSFKGCTGLKKIHLPATLTEIGSGAFQNCTSLAEINFPASLTRIG